MRVVYTGMSHRSSQQQANPHQGTSGLVAEREAARLLGISVAYLRRARLAHVGPPFYRIGRAVRYSADDLRGWLESRRFGTEG